MRRVCDGKGSSATGIGARRDCERIAVDFATTQVARNMSAPHKPQTSITTASLRKMKSEGDKIASLTAYDATFARLLDDAGIDVILVGDSLGMVIQGHDTTVPVQMEDMIYHCRSVARTRTRSLLMADLPFMSYSTMEDALRNSARLMQEGLAECVKLELNRAQTPIVAALSENGIPVCAHFGLTPQTVHKLGGFLVQGRSQSQAADLVQQASELEDAGADLLLVECVPGEVGRQITEAVDVPVIGIGAGEATDGQILVLHDVLGVSDGKRAKFSKDFLSGSKGVREAVRSFVRAVKEGNYPGPEHIYS